MEYSDFTLEQINSKDYKKICSMFFGLVTTEEIKEKLKSILYNGGYKDFGLSSNLSNKNNPKIEMQRRVSIANLLIQNPETFEIIQENNINIFHGTNANALPSILKHGINSYNQSEKNDIDILTGERSTRINGRNFISFTDVLDIAEDYSTLESSKDDENLSFEVIIGTSKEEIEKIGTTRILSDIPEIGVKNNFPKESIKVIGVPSSKVNYVKKIVSNNIKVISIDNIKEKFYYIDDMGIIYFDQNKYEQIKEHKKNKDKAFTLADLKELILSKVSKKEKEEKIL